MGHNKKREDIDDILKIISLLNKQNRKVTCKSIALEMKQTSANIHRILHQFNVDLTPFKTVYKSNQLQTMEQQELELAKRLLRMKTEKLTLKELMAMANFSGSPKQFKQFVAKHHIPYFKHVWFIERLKLMNSENYTLKELYELFNLKEHEITLATFRTRLHENNILFKKIY